MEKILLAFLYLLLIVFVKPNPALAQGATTLSEVCALKGFGTSGCFACQYHPVLDKCIDPSDGSYIACNYPSYFVDGAFCNSLPKEACLPPASGKLEDITVYPCSAQTVPNGGYTCSSTFSCEQCDNDPATSIPQCPAKFFSDKSQCETGCNDPTLVCKNHNGICRDGGCQTNETSYGPVTDCAGANPICCAPADQYLCPGATSISTAVGCVPLLNINETIGFLVKVGVGMVGGIGIFMILFAGLQVLMSKGDPSRLAAGRELLNSAIIGVIMVLFSVFLLRAIGVHILGIL